jgi:hypothetical protein
MILSKKNSKGLALLPTAEEVYSGRVDKIYSLIKEIFDIFAMHDVKILMKSIVGWIKHVIQLYGKELSREAAEPPYKNLLKEFSTGENLAYLINSYAASPDLKIDFSVMY